MSFSVWFNKDTGTVQRTRFVTQGELERALTTVATGGADLSGYVRHAQIGQMLAEYVTRDVLRDQMQGKADSEALAQYATKSDLAEAQLGGGEGRTVDLSHLATKEELAAAVRRSGGGSVSGELVDDPARPGRLRFAA